MHIGNTTQYVILILNPKKTHYHHQTTVLVIDNLYLAMISPFHEVDWIAVIQHLYYLVQVLHEPKD